MTSDLSELGDGERPDPEALVRSSWHSSKKVCRGPASTGVPTMSVLL